MRDKQAPKRRVLISASTYGHIVSFHLPYLSMFRARGWEVCVAAAGVPPVLPEGCRSLTLPLEKRILSLQNLRAARLLRRELTRERYALVITHTSLAAFYTRLAMKGLRSRPKTVNVVHGYLFDEHSPALRRALLLGAERLTARQTDLLLTMNACDFAIARRFRLGARVEGIPGMGVETARFRPAEPGEARRLREERGIPAEAFVLLYPAEFSKRKNQRMLLRALALLPENAVLILPGEGRLRRACRAEAGRLGLDGRVFFPGWVEDMAPWYRLADAAVSASRSEGLPFNVLEAMAARLPVAASAVKGHTDLIEDGVTGLLYPYGDAAECAARVRALMDSPALRESLAARAGEAAARYDAALVRPAVMERYLSALEGE